MKKILAALLVGAFGLSAVAQSVVYDYKASFKRVDPQYKIRTIKEDGSSYKAVTESYGIASDSITGYIVLPVCEDCDGELESSLEDFEGVAYLVRKGDKISKKAELPFVLKTDVDAAAAIFGKEAYIVGYPTDGDPSDVKNLKNAWMTLNFWAPGATDLDPENVIDSGMLIPAAAGEDVWLGFLGLDNVAGSRPYVWNKGFGTVKTISQAEATTLGFCDGDTTPGWSCAIIQSISGSTLGEFAYEGLCGNTPMWDLCDPTEDGMVNVAPIAGTWTLKYNASLSKVAEASKEAEILKKLKAVSTDVIDATEDEMASR